jgi:nicotinate-nucleotide adenylyltransferase
MKIALFGGTFDPVHNAHLAIAAEAMRCCELEKVIFIPNWKSPHKSDQRSTSPKHRLAMLHLATADLPWAEVSNWEIERAEPSYSWMTAEHFANEFPEATLHWILGSDQWNAIHTWSKPERLAQLLNFIVFPRDGVEPSNYPDFHSQEIELETPGSSTAVRKLAAKGRSVAHLVPAKVATYLQEHDIY